MSAGANRKAAQVGLGPWNPGLRSPVPRDVLPLSTLYRTGNAFASLDEVLDLADFTGLPPADLVAFRPERLVVHELLIRVAADISVPDGPGSEDLGVSFRTIARCIADRHLAPHAAALAGEYRGLRAEVEALAREALAGALDAPAPAPADAPRGWRAWFAPSPRPAATGSRAGEGEREAAAIDAWRRPATGATRTEQVVNGALSAVVGAVRARHARVLGDRDVLVRLAADRACNVLGSERLGHAIEPYLDSAIDAEGYRRLPAQDRPVVMNTKGASASGKSTMRPLQRALARRIGVDWAEFALVSPDIFRKYLLDYDTLGDAYRYAGMLTGEELRIVDQKLDRYMAEKARRGRMSHLLIDRFRFDSFAAESEEQGSNLLTRFGSEIFMFFMVTPPHATVERAWERGLRVGRYKTVDDLLYHNVEAFSGMPELFFTWALRADKTVRYEFLDNDVPYAERPRTIAYGENGALVVLDVDALLDIDRFRKIDVDAATPRAVYPDDAALAPERNVGFLGQCVHRLARVAFAGRDTGRVYLEIEAGAPVAADHPGLTAALADPASGAALTALFPGLGADAVRLPAPAHPSLDGEAALTLGRWGPGDEAAPRAPR